jgi:hypothetical protein
LSYAPYCGHPSKLIERLSSLPTSCYVVWADWHGGPAIPNSLKVFAKDLTVDVEDDEIPDDDFFPATTSDTPHVVPDNDDDDPPRRVRFADEAGRMTAAGRMTEALADVEAGRMTEAVRTALSDKISRTERELRRLNTSYNPTANQIEEDQDEEIVFHSTGDANYVQVHYVYNATLASDPGEPKNLGEALQSSESEYWITVFGRKLRTS